MACDIYQFAARAREYLTVDELDEYLGIVKSQPDRSAEVREMMIRAIAERVKFVRTCTIPREEYADMCRREAALSTHSSVADGLNTVKLAPIEVKVITLTALERELFGAVLEVVG